MKTQFGRVVVCTLYNEKSVIQCFCIMKNQIHYLGIILRI